MILPVRSRPPLEELQDIKPLGGITISGMPMGNDRATNRSSEITIGDGRNHARRIVVMGVEMSPVLIVRKLAGMRDVTRRGEKNQSRSSVERTDPVKMNAPVRPRHRRREI
jgi:hypothetical protein